MEKLVKTHLIVTDQWDEYDVKWFKSLSQLNAEPVFTSDNKLKFVIITNANRFEINTMDFNFLIKQAKRLTFPRGRESQTQDRGRIYVKTTGGEEMIAVVVHRHIKKYNQMWDRIECD